MSERFSVIYADPPWKLTAGRALGAMEFGDNKNIPVADIMKTRKLSYKSLSNEQIKTLPVQNVIADDCHLYIWVPNSHLPIIFEIIKAWGFVYSTMIVWAKNPFGGGLGGAFKISTEYLIFARKGNLKTLSTTRGTWFNVKRKYLNGYPRHSAKPDFFRELIVKTSPGPYLEMFAREETPGWSVFGDQVENSIVLT